MLDTFYFTFIQNDETITEKISISINNQASASSEHPIDELDHGFNKLIFN